MIDYKLTNNDISFVTNGNGLLDIELSYFPVTNSQLVPLRLFTPRKGRPFEPVDAIDWEFFFGSQLNQINESNLNLLATQMRAIVGSTIGVTDVDLTQTTIDIDPISRTPTFKEFCWTIDCNEYTL